MNVALVTGASGGLGRAMALALGQAGYAVAVHYASAQTKAQAIVTEIQTAGAEAEAFHADVRQSETVKALFESILKRWDRLDVVVNNAGIVRDGLLLKMTDADWREVIEVNLNGAFWVLRQAARVMSRQRSGCIVNVASLVGLKGGYGNANYAAAKAGLIALTKTAARELGPFHVRVNALLPGFHETAMAASVSASRREAIRADHALQRTTTADDMTAMLLAIVQNNSLSGQLINVDSRILG